MEEKVPWKNDYRNLSLKIKTYNRLDAYRLLDERNHTLIERLLDMLEELLKEKGE